MSRYRVCEDGSEYGCVVDNNGHHVDRGYTPAEAQLVVDWLNGQDHPLVVSPYYDEPHSWGG